MGGHQLCRNCGQKTTNDYCSNCGQKNDVARLSWKTLADGFLSTFMGDGVIGEKRNNIRYGFLLTLWSILLHPGTTVAEYLEGRRRKYFNPITILLLLSGFYGIVSVMTGYVNPNLKLVNNPTLQYINVFVAYCQSHPATWHLILLPFTAFAYKWIFRKRSGLRYAEFLYVGIFVAICSVMLLFVQLLFWQFTQAETPTGYVSKACMVIQCCFSVVVYRALFGVGIGRAIWSWIKVIVISYTLCFFSILLVVTLALAGYYLLDPEGFKSSFGRAVKQLDDSTTDAAMLLPLGWIAKLSPGQKTEYEQLQENTEEGY